MGTLPSDYPQIDCKEYDFCNIEFVAMEKRESEDFKQKYRVVKHFRCEHEEECTKKGAGLLSEEGVLDPRRSSEPTEGVRPRESKINFKTELIFLFFFCSNEQIRERICNVQFPRTCRQHQQRWR